MALAGLLVAWVAGCAQAAGYAVGIAFVPIPIDSAEEKLNKAVGRDPHIDFVYHVRSPTEMFRVIADYHRKGVLIDYLSIGGHGGLTQDKANGRWVGLKLAEGVDGNFASDDIDVQAMQREMDRAMRSAARLRGMRDANSFRALKANEALIDSNNYKLRLIEEASKALAPGATIVLLNCNALDEPTGREFVRRLGELLLAKRGGSIRAAKGKVWLRTPLINFFDDLMVTARWEQYTVRPASGIAAGASDPKKPVARKPAAKEDKAEEDRYVAWIHDSLRTCCAANFGGRLPYGFNSSMLKSMKKGARILGNRTFATREAMLEWVCNRPLKRWAYHAVGVSGVIDGHDVTQLPCRTK